MYTLTVKILTFADSIYSYSVVLFSLNIKYIHSYLEYAYNNVSTNKLKYFIIYCIRNP